MTSPLGTGKSLIFFYSVPSESLYFGLTSRNIRHALFNKSLNAVKQYGKSTALDYKQYRKHQPCTINVERKDIRVFVCFGRAKRPCPAYTRLLRLVKRQTGENPRIFRRMSTPSIYSTITKSR